MVMSCQKFAKEKGWSVFGLQGSQCFTAEDAEETYQKHGSSSGCLGGMGGDWAMDVYRMTGCSDTGKYVAYFPIPITKMHLLSKENNQLNKIPVQKMHNDLG